jgi:hypothetical protein
VEIPASTCTLRYLGHTSQSHCQGRNDRFEALDEALETDFLLQRAVAFQHELPAGARAIFDGVLRGFSASGNNLPIRHVPEPRR